MLVVCTGNVCRSPIIQGLLLDAFADFLPNVDVASAGTAAMVGASMEPYAAEQLALRRASLPGFRARLLTERDVLEADLVLAATRSHRAAVAVIEPRAAERVFTLGEASRLAAAQTMLSEPVGPAELARALHAARGPVDRRTVTREDLPDPYGGSRGDFAACAGEVERLLAPLLGCLGAARRAG
jgi:protein-tyrosine phosphatase